MKINWTKKEQEAGTTLIAVYDKTGSLTKCGSFFGVSKTAVFNSLKERGKELKRKGQSYNEAWKLTQIGKRGWQILAERFESRRAIGEALNNTSHTLINSRLDKYGIKCENNRIPFGWIAKQEGFTSAYTMFFTFYWLYSMTPECIGRYLGGYLGKYYEISRSCILKKIKDLEIPTEIPNKRTKS